jgi:Uma2 family endonuclease
MSPARIITDDELLRLPDDGNRYEVVDGELVVSPGAGLRHERIVRNLVVRLASFAQERGLGEVLPSNLLYRLPGGNRRGPDVSFIAAEKMAALTPDTVFPELPPDLAIEVLSPYDRERRVLDKVGDYLQSGVRLVWVLDPEARSAAIYRSATKVREVDAAGVLDGEDVLPGFRCPLADLLE